MNILEIPPKPQRSSTVQIEVTGFAVLFMPRLAIQNREDFGKTGICLHGRRVDGGTCSTSFMHGGNRAPTCISTLEEGPNMGLTTGFAAGLVSTRNERNGVEVTFNDIGLPCC